MHTRFWVFLWQQTPHQICAGSFTSVRPSRARRDAEHREPIFGRERQLEAAGEAGAPAGPQVPRGGLCDPRQTCTTGRASALVGPV